MVANVHKVTPFDMEGPTRVGPCYGRNNLFKKGAVMDWQLNYELVVIGSGAAGHHGAIQGAKLGKRVAAIEVGTSLGGATINTGTVPSKTVREAVIRVGSKSTSIADRIAQVASCESAVYANQFRRNGIDLFAGEASFISPNLIQVKNSDECTLIEADRILIATGSRPAHNPKIPVDGVAVFDTDAIRNLPPPKRVLTIVGGGVIGVEYACIAAEAGAIVTLIERRPRMLDFVDGELVEALSYHMRRKGVMFRLGEEVDSVIRNSGGKVCAALKSGKQIWSDGLLYAVGRQGNTESLNLAAARLEADERGRIRVNDRFQTEQPHIYAAGDVIGFPSLASVSMEQGRVAVCYAFGEAAQSVPDLFPYGIFTIPEISFVGKTEEQLTQEAIPYEIGIARYQEIARGQIIGDTTGLLKLLFHRETLRLLGVHIIGEGATELIHIGQAVMGLEGSIKFLLTTVFNYPTLAECYKVAALNGVNRLDYPGKPAIGVEYASR
jgi:NAD(P) transhydrogenase